MQDVTCHEVSAQLIGQAADDIVRRARGRWHWMRYDDPSPEKLLEMRDELLDHVAACAVADPALDESSRVALRTAAECSLGALSIGCFPNGDQEIFFPLIERQLSSEDIDFGGVVEQAPTAQTWLDAFALCVISGLVGEWQRVIGLLLRDDFAPAIRAGVPYSKLTSTSEPADLAAMDALCLYLAEASGHQPRHWPTATLRMPEPDERADAARRLDAAGPLTADHRLLRVLLDHDQNTFEEALVARLVEHRAGAGPEPAPRTLLPVGVLALATLATLVHGWDLSVRSGYLPHGILGHLGHPQAQRPASGSTGC